MQLKTGMQLSYQIALQSGVPVIFEGDPGTGKSASITAFAKALGLYLEVVIASIREPSLPAGAPVLRRPRLHHTIAAAACASPCRDAAGPASWNTNALTQT